MTQTMETGPKANILLVDDQPGNLLVLRAILDDLGQTLVEARSGDEALSLLLDGAEFAVVMLDVRMRGLDGFETAKLMRGREKSRHTPIIFLTAYDDNRLSVEEAYSLGAVDYLVKPLIPVVVRAKVAQFVDLFQKAEQIKQQAERLRLAEQREHDRALEQQREWFRVALSSIGDAVITTDAESRVVTLNPVAEALTGWEQAQAKGQPLDRVFRIISEQSRQPIDNPVRNVLQQRRVVGLPGHTVLVSKDNTERPIDDSAAPICDADGKVLGVVLNFRDITERRRAEKELQEAGRRKDEFLATLAHELRNPLAPIMNALELMQRAHGNTDLLEQARSTMEGQIEHMVRLIDDLLDLGRISRNNLELRRSNLELAPMIHQVLAACRPMLEAAGHELHVTIPPEPIHVHADSVRLTQVFGNLLINACKYTEPRGRIWLIIERHGREVLATVKDTGIGIPPDMLSKVFEMFTQVDRSLDRTPSGLGIGLSLVKRLVEMHDGTVTAHSKGRGSGSEFVVRLPLLLDPPKLQQPLVQSLESLPTPSRRILIVDDNRQSAQLLAQLFEMTGNETLVAYDGDEAVKAAASFRPEVILLDLGLPKLNGYDACRRIREQPWGKEIVLIAVTGWGREEDRRKSREAGFNGHLVKPVKHDAVMRLLAELLPAVQ